MFPPNAVPQYKLLGDGGYYSIGQVLYYHGPDFPPDDHRVVMKDVCEMLGWAWTPEQAKAYQQYCDTAMAGYRRAYARRTPDQILEESFEIEAAFGRGVRVVNVITGDERTT